MGALSHTLDAAGPAGDEASAVHALDPRAKLAGLVAVALVAVSTPPEGWPVYLCCAAVLAAVAVAGRVPAGALWRRVRLVLPLVLGAALFLPFLRRGGQEHALGPLVVHEAGLRTLAGVAAKATIGTLSMALLGATTSFPAVLRALEALRTPRLLVLIAGLMYRYLFVVVDEAGRMRAALAARAYRPRSALQAGPLGRMVTAMFLRTHARGERVHAAMLARGYDGRMPQLTPLAAGRADVAFVALVVATLLAARLALGSPA